MRDLLRQLAIDTLFFGLEAQSKDLCDVIGQYGDGVEVRGTDGKHYQVKVEVTEIKEPTHGRAG